MGKANRLLGKGQKLNWNWSEIIVNLIFTGVITIKLLYHTDSAAW